MPWLREHGSCTNNEYKYINWHTQRYSTILKATRLTKHYILCLLHVLMTEELRFGAEVEFGAKLTRYCSWRQWFDSHVLYPLPSKLLLHIQTGNFVNIGIGILFYYKFITFIICFNENCGKSSFKSRIDESTLIMSLWGFVLWVRSL